MSKPNHLLKRGSRYYVRVRIPVDLREHYHPKKDEVHSLGTSDYQEACLKVRIEALAILKEFDRLRKLKSSKKDTITPDDIKRIGDLWLSHLLAEDEEMRNDGLSDKEYKDLQEALEIVGDDDRKRLARGRPDLDDFEVSDFLESNGIKISKDSEQYRMLAVTLLKASVKANEMLKARHAGDVVETPKAVPFASSGVSGETPFLSHLIKRFLDRADQSKPMFKKYNAVLPLFLGVVGDRPIDQLKQIDIENFCQFICRLPPRWADQVRKQKISVLQLSSQEHEKTISPKTYEDTYIAALRPFLNEAIRVFGDQGFPRHLTTDGISYSGKVKAGQNKQRPLSSDEIKELFEGEYLTKARQNEATEHEFWFPLVGLYTGARVNEVCQLNPQSDIREEGGMWIFDFTDEGESDERITKSVKNKTSKRAIPIHQQLIDLGFLKYVKRIQDSGAKLLFPQWLPSVGKASAGAREWFGELLVRLGLRDDTPGHKVTGYHTFRFTMENRALNLEVDNIRVIVGHAGNRTASERGYEYLMELKTKKRILDRIWFDLDLK